MARWKAVIAVSVLTALACGSTPYESLRGSTSAPPPKGDAPGLHGAFLAPPDRALQGVLITVQGESYAAAADGLRAEQKALETALSDAPGCAVRTLDYTIPTGAADQWNGRVELVVDAALGAATSTAERMDQVDRCAGVVASREAEEVQRSGATVWLAGSPPVPVVDDPDRHLPALLAREVGRLATAAAVTGAPQLHPEDLRCVPDGRVTVGRRLLSGVELTATITCRVEETPPLEG